MNPIGKYSRATLLALLKLTKTLIACGLLVASILFTGTAFATVKAEVDRTRVSLGDTLRLTLSASNNEELTGIDLRELDKQFDVLSRSTSSQSRYVNGRATHSKQLLIDIAPKIEGTLQIPALRVGREFTRPITISVAPMQATVGAQESLLFEAEVDKDSVYVQGQLLLTLRIQQAINLDNRSISDLEIDDAYVKALEQNSFQRTIDGRPWIVHEVRYAIFPETSGSLTIPAQVFTARESSNRRSLFDRNGNGRTVRRTTEAVTVNVLPRPAFFPSPTWLPARQLVIEELWSTPPEQLSVGESTTRTVQITAQGLQGAQLPPIEFSPIDGVKFYPDQPAITEGEGPAGILGQRKDSVAIVPTAAGTVVLPEIKIPWWDTKAKAVRFAVLPERTLQIGAATTQFPSAPVQLDETRSEFSQNGMMPGSQPQAASPVWMWLSIFTSIGWLLTLAFIVKQHLHTRNDGGSVAPGENLSERRAFKRLLIACSKNSPAKTRAALSNWAVALSDNTSMANVANIAAHFDDPALAREIQGLERILYSAESSTSPTQEGSWSGEALAQCLQRIRKQRSQSTKTPTESGLYRAPH